MLRLRSHVKTATYGVIIDVGSGSVGVGIVESDFKKKLPEIIFTHRVSMRIPPASSDRDDHMRRLREALFSASLLLSKDGLTRLREYNKKAKISRILVTASSPWAYTIAREVENKHDTEIKISTSFITDLVSSAEEEIAQDVASLEASGSKQLQVVERATVDLKVNGYETLDPIGQSGREFSLSHIVGLLPEEILNAVGEVQEKILPDTEVSAHTFMLVAYCVLRDLFPKVESLMIIDVTGESTEIGIVKDGMLVESVHSSCGYNTLIRDIAEKTKGSHQDILSSLKSMNDKTVHNASEMNVHLEQFSKSLTSVLSAVSKEASIPCTVVVTAPQQLHTLFDATIKETVASLTSTACTTLALQGKILSEVASKENQDVFITVAARFFHKLHGCGEIDTL